MTAPMMTLILKKADANDGIKKYRCVYKTPIAHAAKAMKNKNGNMTWVARTPAGMRQSVSFGIKPPRPISATFNDYNLFIFGKI